MSNWLLLFYIYREIYIEQKKPFIWDFKVKIGRVKAQRKGTEEAKWNEKADLATKAGAKESPLWEPRERQKHKVNF